MTDPLIRYVLAVLPAAAVFSLVGGPAPSAAHAACRARAARERKSARTAETVERGDRTPGRSQPASGSGPSRSDRPTSMTVFVVPKVAKPAEGDGSDVALVRRPGRPDGSGRSLLPATASRAPLLRAQELHRPVYQAHAPPADSHLCKAVVPMGGPWPL